MRAPIGYELKRAQAALNRAMEAGLAEIGLTLPQYATLWALEETPGLSSAELARRSFVTAQTMNDVVLDLERKGLIRRRADPEHGRIRQAQLTSAGRAKLASAGRRMGAIEDRMVSRLTPTQRRNLSAWLQACAANLAEPARPTSKRRAKIDVDGRTLNLSRLPKMESD